jgi:hypothetical protein
MSIAAGVFCLGCHSPEATAPARAADPAIPKASAGDTGSTMVDEGIVIRDGDEYSFSIPRRVQACVLYPVAMFDSATCPAGAKPAEKVPSTEDTRIIAIALLNVEDHGTKGSAILVTTVTKLRHSRQPNQDTANAFADGSIDEVVNHVPGGRLHPGSRHVDVIPHGGQAMARISFDVDGASGQYQTYQHSLSYSVWAPEGPYMMSFEATQASAKAIDDAAAEMAATIRLVHPAPPAR